MLDFRLLIFVSLFLITCCLLWRRRKYYNLIFKIPGPLGLPLIGMAHKMIVAKEDILYIFHEYEQRFGSFLLTWLGPYPFLLVTEPQIVQDVLTSPSTINKSFLYDAVTDVIGHSVILLKDAEWSRHRKLLNPAFAQNILLSFVSIFNKEVDVAIENFADHAKSGVPVQLLEEIHEFVMKITTQTTMGKDLTQMKVGVNQNLMQSFDYMVRWANDAFMMPWLKYGLVQRLLGIFAPLKKAATEVEELIASLIDENLKKPNDVAENIFIKIATKLLKNKEFDAKNVKDETFIMIFAAVETISSTIYHALTLLAMFPQYQRKAYEELKPIYPNRSFDVTYRDLSELTYLDMVINETMRVMATAPVIMREVSQEMRLSNGLVLPKGVSIVIDIFNMHRRHDIWGEDAHSFNPDHFLPKNLTDKHAYAYIPFSKGSRNCIGWKYAQILLKVTLAKLIRNYSFSTDFKFEDLHFIEKISVGCKNPPKLQINERIELKPTMNFTTFMQNELLTFNNKTHLLR